MPPHTKTLQSLAFATLLLALNRAGIAQTQVAPPAPPTLPRVEVTASAETDDDSRRRASIAMSVYGREELDAQGDIDLTDVLKRLPGVSMDAGAPRLRGLGGAYTQILLNGEPAPPGFSLESLAPGDVERIEVIKGATAEYSGVAGTINVVLREPPRTLQREWRSSANFRAVQPGGTTALQWGDRLGDVSFVVPVNISRAAQGSGYLSERTSRTPLGEVRAQAIYGHDEGRSGSVQLAPRLQWKASAADTLNLNAFVQTSASVSNNARQIQDVLGTPSTTVRDQSQTDTDADVRRIAWQWQRKWEGGVKIELKSSWQRTTRQSTGEYTGVKLDESPSLQRASRTDFGDSRTTVGARWSQPLGDAHSVVVGWDVEERQRDELRRVWDNGQEHVDSSDGVPFTARIARSAVFVQDEWAISERWALLPGVRLEQVNTRSGDAASAIDNTARITAPVLHLNYRFDPKGKDQLRASLTRSFKLPDLGALMGRYVFNTTYERETANTPIAADRAGNPGLQPELATGFDLAYEHFPSSGGVLSIGVFSRRIEGLVRQRIALEAVASTGVSRWVSRPSNIGLATSHGLELEIKGRAEEWLTGWFSKGSGVQLRANGSIYRSQVEQVDGPDNRLESQPPWAASAGFDWRIKNSGWTVGASLVLRPAYTTQQTDRQEVWRSAQRTLDAFAAWRMDRNLQLRIGLVNLLAPDTITSNAIEDIDGFSASSTTQRQTLRAINVGLVLRF